VPAPPGRARNTTNAVPTHDHEEPIAHSRPAIATCFGGGGAFGMGFDLGVADGMLAEGVDLRKGPMIGTSAGGYTVAALATGIAFERIAELWSAYTATHGSIWVRTAELTEQIYGTATARGVASVALRLWTFRRVLLWGDEHTLSDIVAASASPIPFARPHRIGRRRYVDGGLRRMASADLTPPAELLVLITPFCGPGQGFLGRAGARQADREIRHWKQSSGGQALHLTPSQEIRSLGVKGKAIVADMELAVKTFDLSREIGRSAAKELQRDFPVIADQVRPN
jgi:hypothetical protein